MEISNHTELFIIKALPTAKALTVSLGAEEDGCVIGHIALDRKVFFDRPKREK